MSEKHLAGELKEHMILDKTHTTSLGDVRILNMWGYELTDVSVVQYLRNVETISLSLNKIRTLQPFAGLRKLRCLFLRQNEISDIHEVDYLIDLPCLKQLMLRDNPIAQQPDYRRYILRALPGLEKLDDEDVRGIDMDDIKQPVMPPPRQDLSHKDHGFSMHGEENIPNPPRKQRILNLNQGEKKIQPFRSQQHLPMLQPARDRNMLQAVLALLPELTDESLQIVVDAISEQRKSGFSDY